jgi:predicted SAM-dependent methyltransferase
VSWQGVSIEAIEDDDMREAMQDRIKDELRAVSLFDLAKSGRNIVRRAKRFAAGSDRRLRRGYLAPRSSPRMLQIGCGANVLEGWLNTDYSPQADVVLHLDATRRFPFGNDEFHYIFSEHVIEHFSYQRGFRMLSECFRVLKPSGKLRVATPDLRFLFDLYEHERSELMDDYLQWAVRDNRLVAIEGCEDIFVVNNFVRDWGHTFIYDEKVLRRSMERVGFRDIRRFAVNDSDDEHLRGIEYEKRMPAGFLNLESVVLEGSK